MGMSSEKGTYKRVNAGSRFLCGMMRLSIESCFRDGVPQGGEEEDHNKKRNNTLQFHGDSLLERKRVFVFNRCFGWLEELEGNADMVW